MRVGSGVGRGEKVLGIFWLGIGTLPRVLEDGEVSAVVGICVVAVSCLRVKYVLIFLILLLPPERDRQVEVDQKGLLVFVWRVVCDDFVVWMVARLELLVTGRPKMCASL